MALIRVREYLKRLSLDKNIIELSESSATVDEAAHALGVTPGEIAKTVSLYLDDKPILVVVRGDAKIDNAKYKSTFNKKAKMIPYDQVEESIGHAPGGVCPFGINEDVDVYLDVSLKSFDYVYPAAGNSNSAVKLTIEELERASNYKTWVDVTK